jgi:hypothetical protein
MFKLHIPHWIPVALPTVYFFGEPALQLPRDQNQRRSCSFARQQQAKSWELRAAMSDTEIKIADTMPYSGPALGHHWSAGEELLRL